MKESSWCSTPNDRTYGRRRGMTRWAIHSSSTCGTDPVLRGSLAEADHEVASRRVCRQAQERRLPTRQQIHHGGWEVEPVHRVEVAVAVQAAVDLEQVEPARVG